MATYKSDSPYFATKQNSWFLGQLQYRHIPKDKTDIFITIDQSTENKATLISHNLYNSPAYWWVVQICNIDNIRDVTRDLTIGTTIRMPTMERLLSLLG